MKQKGFKVDTYRFNKSIDEKLPVNSESVSVKPRVSISVNSGEMISRIDKEK